MDNKSIGVATALLLTLFVLAASNLAQSVLEPVVFAFFVIALIWPLQKTFQRRVPRSLALFLTILVTLAVMVSLSSMIVWGGGEIADWLRRNLTRIQETFASSTKWLEEHDIFVGSLLTEHFSGAWLIGVLQAVAVRANILVGFALLVFIYVAMGLAETESFRKKLESLKDEDTGRRLLIATRQTAEKIRTYMVIRTAVSIATGVLVWGFILFMRIELATAWGVLSFALNFLPYIGPLIVTVLPPLFAFVQTGSVETALVLFAGLVAIQLIVGNYLEPVLAGSTLDISPTVVVFAVLLWTFLWGMPGAFIGVPLAIAFITFCQNFSGSRWIADLLSEKSPSMRTSASEPMSHETL